MSKARTPEEGVPLSRRAARLIGRGRGPDVQLPMGPRDRPDPRLRKPDVLGNIREAKKGLSKVRELTGRR